MNDKQNAVPDYESRGFRTSKLALFSTISAVLLPLCLLAHLVTKGSSGLNGTLVIILLGSLALTFYVGLISAIRITVSRGSLAGNAYAVIGILLSGLILGIVLLYGLGFASKVGYAYRMACGTNLAGLGKAMLIYANDYDDRFPKAGAAMNRWTDSLGGHANTGAWRSKQRGDAYGMGQDNGQAGAVTTSASLYLLVRYADVSTNSFVCKREVYAGAFRPEDWHHRGQTEGLTDLWDFGYYAGRQWNQTTHVSYGYHHPFGKYALTVADDPGMVVSADRSPWLDLEADRVQRWSAFEPDLNPNTGSAEQGRMGNSLAHEGHGQNVLFLDSHVSFEKRAFVGIENDNIYTVQDSGDPGQNPKGRLPVPYDAEASSPRHRRDSVLLQETGRASN